MARPALPAGTVTFLCGLEGLLRPGFLAALDDGYSLSLERATSLALDNVQTLP